MYEKFNSLKILSSRAKFKDFQVRFFECVSLPYEFFEEIIDGEENYEIYKAFSQWRLDFNSSKTRFNLNEKQKQIISVLEKILTRGHLTLASPKLENNFRSFFNCGQIENVNKLLKFILYNVDFNLQNIFWLDSKEEEIFYQKLLPSILGKNFAQFVLPQVFISSLLEETIQIESEFFNQRVDFCIFYPDMSDKLVVEIDGRQHIVSTNPDKFRDETLTKQGYKVIRIAAEEIREQKGNNLTNLIDILSKIKQEKFDQEPNSVKFLLSLKISHQIQLALLQAIQSGHLSYDNIDSWCVVTDLDEIGIFDASESNTILTETINDFKELFLRLNKLYSYKLKSSEPKCRLFSQSDNYFLQNSIFISLTNKHAAGLQTFYIQNIYFPFNILNSNYLATPVVEGLDKPSEEDLKYFLNYLFRKSDFWEGQYEGITRLLAGKDTLLLLPTGGGKSMVYQLASLLLPGKTIVIDPIISLMEDQIFNLTSFGIDRCISITSQITNPNDRKKILQFFGFGEFLFVFVSPERFQIVEFRESLRTLTTHSPVSLIVVDEAHCVSEWGHDFRTAYLNIGRISRSYCQSNSYVPPLIAMTGTASRSVLKDIQRELQIEDFEAIITPKSFDREELKFIVDHKPTQEKKSILLEYLSNKLPDFFNSTFSNFFQPQGKNTYSGLIFCPHVDGDHGVVKLAEEIKENLRIQVGIYSGKKPKGWDKSIWERYKRIVTYKYKINEIPLLICTKAFGIGIDKPNIRYTIHYNIPPSIEAFYQEAGRAGRDKNRSICIIIVSLNDERYKDLLDPNKEIEEIKEILSKISKYKEDDLTRILYFHTKSFRGVKQELENIKIVLNYLGDISNEREAKIVIPKEFSDGENADQAREITEKAIHRLLLIGVINDYTIDYSKKEFTVKISGASKNDIINHFGKYVENYLYSRKDVEISKTKEFINLPLDNFVLKVVSLLLRFIYDVIERGRRRAIYEMILACENPQNIRERILRYLEFTGFSELLERILSDQTGGLILCKDAFNKVTSPYDASELRGQVSRYLESYPDHPGLLMLRALSEAYSKDKNEDVVTQNFFASMNSAITNYKVLEEEVFDLVAWSILNISKINSKLALELIRSLVKLENRQLTRILIKELPINLTYLPAWHLLNQLIKKCENLVNIN